MIKGKFNKTIKYFFELFTIFFVAFLFIVFSVFIISYYMGFEFFIEEDNSNNIELKVYKKESKQQEISNDEQIDIYINNDLKINDEDLIDSVHTENDYFYNQLDDYGKRIYDRLVENSENLKSGDYVINFRDEFSSMLLNRRR